jgi:hypothetical protein
MDQCSGDRELIALYAEWRTEHAWDHIDPGSRTAPVEVRRWIERELAKSRGLQPQESKTSPLGREHLVACSPQEAIAVLSLIRGMLPVVNVFFELGRQGTSFGREGVEALRLVDILHHARLQSVDQVIACLDLINEAVRRVTGDVTATLYALDDRGDCFIATQTQQSVLRVWQQAIASEEVLANPTSDELPAAASVAPFPVTRGAFPSSGLHPDRFDTAASGTSVDNRQGKDTARLPADS